MDHNLACNTKVANKICNILSAHGLQLLSLLLMNYLSRFVVVMSLIIQRGDWTMWVDGKLQY